MHEAAKSNQVKNEKRFAPSRQLLSLTRSTPNHREPMCRNKSFRSALLQQSHQGWEHTGQKQCVLLNLYPPKVPHSSYE